MTQERLLTRAARLVLACCKPSRARKQAFLALDAGGEVIA